MTAISLTKRQNLSRSTEGPMWLPYIMCAVLLLTVVLSALSIIYCKDYSRRAFGELQQLQQVRDTVQVAWGQLLLEQSTWSTQARIQSHASKMLHMIVPSKTVVILS